MELVNNVYRKASYGLSAKKNLFCWLMLLFTLLTVIPAAAQDLEWAKSAGGTGGNFGVSTAVDDNGNRYVTGSFAGTATFGAGETNETTMTSVANSDIFVAKYDNSGALLWAKSAGGTGIEEGKGIAVDGDGNSYVTGYFGGTATFGAGETNETTLTGAGSGEVFVAKYDNNGALIWAKSAGGTSNDIGNSITVDGDGNSYVSGFFGVTATFGAGETNETALTSTGNGDIFVAKYNNSGALIWAKRAGGTGGDTGYCIAVDGSGNSYVTGTFGLTAIFGAGETNETALTSTGAFDIFLAMYDNSGALIWAKGVGGTSFDYGLGIAVDGSGNSYVTGAFQFTATFGAGETNETILTSAGSTDIYMAKYDNSGALQWARRTGGTDGDGGGGIAVNSSGNSFVTGSFSGTVTFGAGESNETILTSAGVDDIFVAKYNTSGALIWAKSAGGPNIDAGNDIAIDGSGNSYVTGFFNGTATFGAGETNKTALTSAGNSDIFVAKFQGGNLPAELDICAEIDVLIGEVDALIIDPGTPRKAKSKLNKAKNYLNSACDNFTAGEYDRGFNDLADAADELDKAMDKGANAGAIRVATVDLARLIATETIDDATAFAGDPAIDQLLSKAADALADGDAERDDDKFDKAVKEYGKAWEYAAEAIQLANDTGTGGEISMDLDPVLNAINALLANNPNKKARKALQKAHSKVTDAQSKYDNGDIEDGYGKLEDAVGYLEDAADEGADADPVIANLLTLGRDYAVAKITEAQTYAGTPEVDQQITKAQNYLSDGDAAAAQGKNEKAMDRYGKAWVEAQEGVLLGNGLGKTTGDPLAEIPTRFGLEQNYPNPFNPETTIRFALPQSGNVTLKIFNLSGQLVRTLVSSDFAAGQHQIVWNGRNDLGEKVASGMYLYRITTGSFVQTKKMMLMK